MDAGALDFVEGPRPRKAVGAPFVIGAASLGTAFEWYDFFLYGALASDIVDHFFSGVSETTGYLFALLAFAAGFAVRPLGALIFGRIGDLWGRKNTFLVTMLLMGLSTFAVGMLPSFSQVGLFAPLALIILRLVQGLAVGGEYGGAAIYIAEHAPPDKRGFYTGFIQVTATFGLFLSLVVVYATRRGVGEDAFADWGWRIPFLTSVLLLLVSVWIRLQLEESPTFQKMIEHAKLSRRPIAEAFGSRKNLKLILISIFGLNAGVTVVFYNSQLYALFFMGKVLKVDGALTNELLVVALLLGSPLFVFFGWLSDRIGRKTVIMAGFLLAALTYFPLFKALTAAANPALVAAAAASPVAVIGDPADCSFQFDPVGKQKHLTSCDIAKAELANAGISYANISAPAGQLAVIKVGDREIPSFRGVGLPRADLAAQMKSFDTALTGALDAAGYPQEADENQINRPLVVAILLVMVIYVTMTYGPLAALLVEMFPARIRYTSMAVSYNLAVGWLGGFLPAAAFAMVVASGNIYFGLWYAVAITAVSLVVGWLTVKDVRHVDINL
jgi:MFS family permease